MGERPLRFSHTHNDKPVVWCLDRGQTCWWYEDDGYWTYQLCDPQAFEAEEDDADDLPDATPIAAALPMFGLPVLQHVSLAIGAAIADAEAAALISQQAADAQAHAEDISVQATAAATQAQISAAHAADEVNGLADVFDHVANDRSQDLTAATVASDTAQASSRQIAQAHADLADVGTPTQALSGAPTVERGVAWSTLGQASSSGETACINNRGSEDSRADTAAAAPGSSADSRDAAVPATGSGTHSSPDTDLFLQAGGAGTVVTVAIPIPQPIATANIIGQAAQAVASIMPLNAFGIGCSLTPSNTRAAAQQLRRERSASVSRRRSDGPAQP